MKFEFRRTILINTNSKLAAVMENHTEPRKLRRKILYGLPCANCRSYYESNLAVCPICECSERISQNTTLLQLTAAF